MNYGPASKYYDLFASRDDIEFYKELAFEHKRKALDVGVGTGRVAIELARAGVTVWGIDSSRYMLNVARRKLRKESASVRGRIVLRYGDMRDFRLHEMFPFVYIASSTFEHCITDDDQKKCLTSVFNALERKGTLAFDISQLAQGKPDASWWVDRSEPREGVEVVRTILSRWNPLTNVVCLNLFFDVYRKGALEDRYYEYGEARISSKQDIERLLKDVGFEIRDVYGDFDKSPYGDSSRRAIFIACKQ